MRNRWMIMAALVGVAFTSACSSSTMDDDGIVGSRRVDLDADSIPDSVEGNGDPDGDGVPNHRDRDSDGDGIEDILEAGDLDLETDPIDTDSDGIPNFLDDDSDGNGILDRDEAFDDFDGDGRLDSQDLDDDDDGISDRDEISDGHIDCDADGEADPPGSPSAPPDCDGDGRPNFVDPDGDGDLILDVYEGTNVDTDQDNVPDRFDPDSDNDGIPDRDEHRAAPGQPPADADEDNIPDFRDPDSDGDGVSDADERIDGTSPYLTDSDGDGSSDLIEKAAGTNPLFDGDNPKSNGDFIFVVPFEEEPDPDRDTLGFRTNIQEADVYFLFDRTGSMLTEVNAMRAAIGSIIENLTCRRTVVACTTTRQCATGEVCSQDGRCMEDPEVRGCIPSFHTGAGVYGGDPSAGFAFDNLQSIGPDGSATSSALPLAVGGYGTDEAMFASVQCLMNPESCPIAYTSQCSETGVGCMGYRADSQRILMLITDEDNEWTNAGFTAESAATELRGAGARFIGIDAANGGAGNGIDDLNALATESLSFGSDGQPLVRSGDGADVVAAATEAIIELVTAVPTRVTIDADEVDAGALDFLDFLEVNVSGTDIDGDGMVDCEVFDAGELEDTDADSRNDTFSSVAPGRRVCWDVHPKMNTTVAPARDPLLFQAVLTVRGNGAVLDTRDVFFLIPPKPPEIPVLL